MEEQIQKHTDGSLWVECTIESPKPDKTYWVDGLECRVFHPQAKVDYSSHGGEDDHYTCPCCKHGWWVEYDG